MSYARFSDSDLYIFMNSSGYLDCCGCFLSADPEMRGFQADSTQEMVDHIAEHREAGHDVPDGIEDALWEDDWENWVDYQRCMVIGCEERATSGSPTGGGYIWACGIKHGRELGGFKRF